MYDPRYYMAMMSGMGGMMPGMAGMAGMVPNMAAMMQQNMHNMQQAHLKGNQGY